MPNGLRLAAGAAWIVCVCAMVMPEPLAARNSDQSSSRSQYPRISGQRLDTCSLCHGSGNSLNTFGSAYRNSGKAWATIEQADTDGDGFSNVAEMNALTFPDTRTDYPHTSLVFPLTLQNSSASTGFAFTNTGASDATLVFDLLDNAGQPVTPAGGQSYRILTLRAGGQLANLSGEIFGGDLQLSGGSVRVVSGQDGVKGFFLTFDNVLTAMDGAPASTPYRDQYIPVRDGAEVHLVNPSQTSAVSVEVRS